MRKREEEEEVDEEKKEVMVQRGVEVVEEGETQWKKK